MKSMMQRASWDLRKRQYVGYILGFWSEAWLGIQEEVYLTTECSIEMGYSWRPAKNDGMSNNR